MGMCKFRVLFIGALTGGDGRGSGKVRWGNTAKGDGVLLDLIQSSKIASIATVATVNGKDKSCVIETDSETKTQYHS